MLCPPLQSSADLIPVFRFLPIPMIRAGEFRPCTSVLPIFEVPHTLYQCFGPFRKVPQALYTSALPTFDKCLRPCTRVLPIFDMCLIPSSTILPTFGQCFRPSSDPMLSGSDIIPCLNIVPGFCTNLCGFLKFCSRRLFQPFPNIVQAFAIFSKRVPGF